MFYREAGQFKTTYAADMAIFPIRQDRYGLALILLVAFVAIPAFGNQFLLNTMMIPFLILSLAAIGLNLLTGYTGLLSLGTGAFMGVGAYACYKLETFFPEVNILVWIVMSGFVSAFVGVAVRPAEPEDQGLLSGGGDACGAVFSPVVLHTRALACERQRFGRDRSADPDAVRPTGHRPDRDASHALFRRA